MVTICFYKEVDDLHQAAQGRIAADPFPFHGYDSGEDPEAGAADGAGLFTKGVAAEVRFIIRFVDIVPLVFCFYGVVAFAGQTADWMSVMPKEAEGLALDDIEQCGVGETFYDADGGNGALRVCM